MVTPVVVTEVRFIVTAPFCAKARPVNVAPELIDIDVKARMEPSKWEPTPMVAELPTCQKTLLDLAPPINTMLLFTVVIKVDPAWKIQTASGLPPASSVKVPVTPKELGLL